MTRRVKPPTETDPDQAAMLRAIHNRLLVMWPKAKGPTERYELLSKVSDVGVETIRKFMKGESSPTLKNISLIARAVGLTLPELFEQKSPESKQKKAAKEDSGEDLLQRR